LTTAQTSPPPAEAPLTRRRTRWAYIVALILAASFLYLALKDVDWAVFVQVIARGRYALLPLLLLLSSFTFFLRSQRWRVLLTAQQPLPRLQVFWANMIGYLGNAYLPARAGELLRTLAVAKTSEISGSYVLATALTERLLDVVALVLVSALSLLTIPDVPVAIQVASRTMAVAGLAGLVVLFLAPAFEGWIVAGIRLLPVSSPWQDRLAGMLRQFLLGMQALQKDRRWLRFILMTMLIWLADGLNAAGLAWMLRQPLSLAQALLLIASLGLASAIPSTPGFIGVYQFVAVTVLVPFGFSPSAALAYIIVAQVFNYLLVSFWGILGIWKLGMAQDVHRIERMP
jgi:glycosyltransferase 2 family protein